MAKESKLEKEMAELKSQFGDVIGMFKSMMGETPTASTKEEKPKKKKKTGASPTAIGEDVIATADNLIMLSIQSTDMNERVIDTAIELIQKAGLLTMKDEENAKQQFRICLDKSTLIGDDSVIPVHGPDRKGKSIKLKVIKTGKVKWASWKKTYLLVQQVDGILDCWYKLTAIGEDATALLFPAGKFIGWTEMHKIKSKFKLSATGTKVKEAKVDTFKRFMTSALAVIAKADTKEKAAIKKEAKVQLAKIKKELGL